MTSTRLVALVCALSLLLAGCAGGALRARSGPEPAGPASTGERPNIVFVLVDDMDQGLVRFMPHLQQLQKQGVTFSNFTVTDSLCCPSRSSILTGKFPHNTGVFTNKPPDGGFEVFHREQERDTIGTQLQQAGYRTGFLGKYLNGYQPADKLGGDRPFVPPGWHEWAVAGNGYPGYDYQLNVNGNLVEHGDEPGDYLTDVLAGRGNDFIRHSGATGEPFFLEVAPFVPHTPSTPAPRDVNEFPGLTAPRDPSFNEPDRSDKPEWLRQRPPLTPDQLATLDPAFRKRAQSLQAVDDMLAGFQQTLAATGQADRTQIVFSSDNGYHLGQHGLLQGKQTAFSTDVNVPLIAAGPGIPAGRTVDQTVENIDLRPTFAELAGAPPSPDVDGQSFAGLLRGDPAPSAKNVALVEHHGPNNGKHDPDRQAPASGNPPTYTAIRTTEGNYVEYTTGEREYYDRARDPYELDNTYPALSPGQQAALHDTLTRLAQCRGTAQCAAAAHLP
ncbi:sulfatase family protein [Amycolatopsis nigrescens]|uniref:sulfatase family protein n=1 Tax=Amycolatopsis nigrescens TaxID=381445 RepID=UPI0003A9005E|nr:sulfatase [Amycolatopsis nigrescens]